MAGRSSTRLVWKPLLVLAVLLAGGLAWGLAGALAVTSAPSPSPTAGEVALHLGWTQEPDNLNPYVGYQAECWEIWALNYDYLFGSGDHNQPTLDLASEFPTQQNGGISTDGRIWTIHIRQGVKWQDGVPLTAADVAFSYNYVIKNDLTQYTLDTGGILKASALNATMVKLTCAHPMATGFMETQSLPIVPQHIWQHVSADAAQSSYTPPVPLVGSGPFQVVAWKKGSYIEMDRNPNYWGPKPTIQKIFLETYQDPETMVTDLEAGRLDGAWGIPVAQFRQLKSLKGFTSLAYPYYSLDDLEFNCSTSRYSTGNPVLRDWRFRQALNYAIDKPDLCALAYNGLAEPGTTVLLPGVWSNPDYHWQPSGSQAYTFDLAKANQLLTAAGYPLKNGVRLNKQGKRIALRLETATDLPNEQTAVKLIAGWLQKLGIKITLSVVDSGTLEGVMTNVHGQEWAPDFDLVAWGLTGNYDPGQTMNYFTSSSIGLNNTYYWSDPTFDKLALAQASAVDLQKRAAIIWRMQQIMYQQSPDIIFAYPDNLEAINTSRWTGWETMFGGSGPAWQAEGNIQSYLDLRPIAAGGTSGGSRGLLTAGIVVAVVIVGIVVFVVRRRRRHVQVEE